MERSLGAVLPRRAPGGIVVVDDCVPDVRFDGALAAHAEAVDREGLQAEILHGRSGVVRIPA